MGAVGVLRQRAIFVLLTLCLTLVAMFVSYAMVGWLTRGLGQEQVFDPLAQRRATLLLGFADDLSGACNAYARVMTKNTGTDTREAYVWVDRVFRRDLRFLEQRMDDNAMTSLPVFLQLRAAVVRCSSMARHPEDRVLRSAAFADARGAVDAVNAHVKTVAGFRAGNGRRVPVNFAE